MSDTFKYSLIQNKEGNFVVESTIKSFNLDQITEKDIVSFYKNFSLGGEIFLGKTLLTLKANDDRLEMIFNISLFSQGFI